VPRQVNDRLELLARKLPSLDARVVAAREEELACATARWLSPRTSATARWLQPRTSATARWLQPRTSATVRGTYVRMVR
jgi:hypothetical protein